MWADEIEAALEESRDASPELWRQYRAKKSRRAPKCWRTVGIGNTNASGPSTVTAAAMAASGGRAELTGRRGVRSGGAPGEHTMTEGAGGKRGRRGGVWDAVDKRGKEVGSAVRDVLGGAVRFADVNSIPVVVAASGRPFRARLFAAGISLVWALSSVLFRKSISVLLPAAPESPRDSCSLMGCSWRLRLVPVPAQSVVPVACRKKSVMRG